MRLKQAFKQMNPRQKKAFIRKVKDWAAEGLEKGLGGLARGIGDGLMKGIDAIDNITAGPSRLATLWDNVDIVKEYADQEKWEKIWFSFFTTLEDFHKNHKKVFDAYNPNYHKVIKKMLWEYRNVVWEYPETSPSRVLSFVEDSNFDKFLKFTQKNSDRTIKLHVADMTLFLRKADKLAKDVLKIKKSAKELWDVFYSFTSTHPFTGDLGNLFNFLQKNAKALLKNPKSFEKYAPQFFTIRKKT